MSTGKANKRKDGSTRRQLTVAIRVDRRLCAALALWANQHWATPPPISSLIRGALSVVLEDVASIVPDCPETTNTEAAEAYLEEYSVRALGDTDPEAVAAHFKRVLGTLAEPTDEELQEAEQLLRDSLEDNQ